jgi:uncharacterized protein RhaS with RHS repeats
MHRSTIVYAKSFKPGSGGTGYTYDASGNLTSDSYKAISSITYNHLNLPSLITFSDNLRKIEFTYDATGKKLKKKASSNGTTYTIQDYVAGIEYNSSSTASTPKVEAIYHSEGRLYNTSSSATPTWRIEYNILFFQSFVFYLKTFGKYSFAAISEHCIFVT